MRLTCCFQCNVTYIMGELLQSKYEHVKQHYLNFMSSAVIKWKMKAIHFILHRALQPLYVNSGIIRPLGHNGALTTHTQFIIHQSSYSPPRRSGRCLERCRGLLVLEAKIKDNNSSLEVSCTLKMERTEVDKKITFLLVQFSKEIIKKEQRVVLQPSVRTLIHPACT